MTFLIQAPESFQPERYRQLLADAAPDIPVRLSDEPGDPGAVVFAAGWNPPDGYWHQFPNLQGITSLGAGVDSLLRDADIPPELPIARLVDDEMARRMTEYMLLAVLSHKRRWLDYAEHPDGAGWGISIARPGHQVGILGLGHLGTAVAQGFQSLGYGVAGWVRSPRESPLPNLPLYVGDRGLPALLQGADYVISLLPLTPETRNRFDRAVLSEMKPGAYFINAGRGQTVVEADLLALVQSGHLSGACLDVFQEEPLPADHPFRKEPRIRITPHISSITPPESVLPQIIDNYRRAASGQPLLNLIDRTRGY